MSAVVKRKKNEITIKLWLYHVYSRFTEIWLKILCRDTMSRGKKWDWNVLGKCCLHCKARLMCCSGMLSLKSEFSVPGRWMPFNLARSPWQLLCWTQARRAIRAHYKVNQSICWLFITKNSMSKDPFTHKWFVTLRLASGQYQSWAHRIAKSLKFQSSKMSIWHLRWAAAWACKGK